MKMGTITIKNGSIYQVLIYNISIYIFMKIGTVAFKQILWVVQGFEPEPNRF